MRHVHRFALLALVLSACSDLPQQAALQDSLTKTVADGVAPGVALYVDHRHYESFAASAGVSSLTTSAVMQPSDRFRAGSILKTFVAVATLQLVEQKKRSLDETLPQLLPVDITSRIANAERITLRMLLNHTSGIPDWAASDAIDARAISEPTHVWSLTEQIALAQGLPTPFSPGTGWAYSNTNYTLLGEILRVTTGQPWRQVLRERVIARASLSHTELPDEGNVRCEGCASGYEYPGETALDATEVDPSMAGAAGGSALVTTAKDLAAFMRALMDGRLFDDKATLQTMLTFTEAPVPEELQTAYGLGLVHLHLGNAPIQGHLGGAPGFQSFMLYLPQTDLIVTGFMNRRGDLRAFLLPILEIVSEIP